MDALVAADQADTAELVRAAIGDDGFDAAWSSGGSLGLEPAVSELRTVLAVVAASQPGA
jgi:hypothetical protein